MKIDIHQGPPTDIFKNRRMFILIFTALLALSCSGLLMGIYAITADTNYYAQLETLALVFFVTPAPFAAYFGEKLQQYKKLTPPQRKELFGWMLLHPEIKSYCDQVIMADRQPVRAEYEACRDWIGTVNRPAT